MHGAAAKGGPVFVGLARFEKTEIDETGRQAMRLGYSGLRLRHNDCDSAQSRDDLIRGSLACFHGAFQITLSVDGGVFTAEMDAVLRLAFDTGKAGILTDLPVAVAAATVRITRPPIHCGTTVPL